MICGGCRREIEIGERYIEGTASEYLGEDVDPRTASLMADILSGRDDLSGEHGDKIFYCEDCTVPGGDFMFSTYYGDEDD